jgi:hypothetical protein
LAAQHRGAENVKISEFTDQKKAAIIARLLPGLEEHNRGARRARVQIVACLVGAGFCAFGSLCSIALGSGGSLGLAALVPWYTWLVFFALAGSYLFAIAWTKFMLHNVTMRAGDRAYLILLFENYAKKGIKFSAEEIVEFLRSTPDSHSLTNGASGSRSLERVAR